MPRGPKSSLYMGAKKRGRGCHALEMRRRRGGRFELAGFPTEKHAGVGRDFFIVLDGGGDGDLSKQLNFPQCCEDFARFAKERGMEFKVDPEEEKGKFKWDGDKKKRFIALVDDLYQIISAEPARAAEIEVADTVQVNNGGLTLLQGEGEPLEPHGDPIEVQVDPVQGHMWVVDEGFQQYDDCSKKFYSRGSESAIYPKLSNEELQAHLSEKDEVIVRLTAELKELKDFKAETLLYQARPSEKDEVIIQLTAQLKEFKAKALLSVEALAECAGVLAVRIDD